MAALKTIFTHSSEKIQIGNHHIRISCKYGSLPVDQAAILLDPTYAIAKSFPGYDMDLVVTTLFLSSSVGFGA